MKTLLFFTLLFIGFNVFSQTTFIDSRDQHEYKTVKIGDKIWLAENFAYKPESGNYWAYDNNEQNVAQFAYLYDWETAKQIVPKGWHLATKAEFEELLNSFGGDETYDAFLALKEGGSSGFNALKAGFYWTGEGFSGIKQFSIFWTANEDDPEYAWDCKIGAEGEVAAISVSNKLSGLSVRLVKD
ncbi:MAG: hypothetical protein L3J74_06770 [Bacteroidales bacterium]|nr:hypothetical protein [Bacteroidales bacterium]